VVTVSSVHDHAAWAPGGILGGPVDGEDGGDGGVDPSGAGSLVLDDDRAVRGLHRHGVADVLGQAGAAVVT